MLPRAALHQENVISNEQVKRQRVEAGQIASNFLGQHMVYPCLCFCHYAFITVTNTHLCIFVVFFVKLPAWVWSEQRVHTANTSSCAQGRCCRERGYKFKKLWRWNFDKQFSRTIVGYNEKWFNTTFFIPVCIFIASCTGVCSLWTSLTILALSCFFHRLSSPSWSLCFSLRIPCFFLTYVIPH